MYSEAVVWAGWRMAGLISGTTQQSCHCFLLGLCLERSTWMIHMMGKFLHLEGSPETYFILYANGYCFHILLFHLCLSLILALYTRVYVMMSIQTKGCCMPLSYNFCQKEIFLANFTISNESQILMMNVCMYIMYKHWWICHPLNLPALLLTFYLVVCSNVILVALRFPN